MYKISLFTANVLKAKASITVPSGISKWYNSNSNIPSGMKNESEGSNFFYFSNKTGSTLSGLSCNQYCNFYFFEGAPATSVATKSMKNDCCDELTLDIGWGLGGDYAVLSWSKFHYGKVATLILDQNYDVSNYPWTTVTFQTTTTGENGIINYLPKHNSGGATTYPKLVIVMSPNEVSTQTTAMFHTASDGSALGFVNIGTDFPKVDHFVPKPETSFFFLSGASKFIQICSSEGNGTCEDRYIASASASVTRVQITIFEKDSFMVIATKTSSSTTMSSISFKESEAACSLETSVFTKNLGPENTNTCVLCDFKDQKKPNQYIYNNECLQCSKQIDTEGKCEDQDFLS